MSTSLYLTELGRIIRCDHDDPGDNAEFITDSSKENPDGHIRRTKFWQLAQTSWAVKGCRHRWNSGLLVPFPAHVHMSPVKRKCVFGSLRPGNNQTSQLVYRD